MKWQVALVQYSVFLFGVNLAVAQDYPTLKGYVTRVGSRTDFDANGLKVFMKPGTPIYCDEQFLNPCPDEFAVALGQRIEVFGSLNIKKGTLTATKIAILSATQPKEVAGSAIIDEIPRAGTEVKPDERLVRADGYLILITPLTKVEFRPPLKSGDDIMANVWINYEGYPRPDGLIVARNAVFTPNIIKHSEEHLRTRNEYDPAAVDDGDRQSGASKFFKGMDIKRIAAYKDATMQARAEEIGRKLIPEYQNRLPDGDESKLNFRFQVVDSKAPCGWVEANGIILVSKELVLRMENDSQLAAVLGGEIAGALEKQEYRLQPAKAGLTSAFWAGAAAGIFIPGAGIAESIAGGQVARSIYRAKAEQRIRVGLRLMNDANFDVTEAPKAYWVIASKKSKPLAQINIPHAAGYAYQLLASPMWKDTAHAAH